MSIYGNRQESPESPDMVIVLKMAFVLSFFSFAVFFIKLFGRAKFANKLYSKKE